MSDEPLQPRRAVRPALLSRVTACQAGRLPHARADGTILYVGKARHLRNRVELFHGRAHGKRRRCRRADRADRGDRDRSEIEVLLLESYLIKRNRPRYNVLLKDDKSFPFIHLTAHEYPRLADVRGTRSRRAVFGPYPTALRLARRCCCCRNCFAYVRARTRSSRTAREPACSTDPALHRAVASGSSRRRIPSMFGCDPRARGPQRRGRRGPASSHRCGGGGSAVRGGSEAARPLAMSKEICVEPVGSAHRRPGHRRRGVVRGRPTAASRCVLRGGRNLGSTNYFMKAALEARAIRWVRSSSSTTWRVGCHRRSS